MSRAGNFRFAFAGDRDVAVEVLTSLIGAGYRPEALMVSDPARASHAGELRDLCGDLAPYHVFTGTEFRSESARETLADLHLDLVVAVHFPYLVPAEALDLARLGWINLHPAYLPYNRGWHTPSWAILDGTPIGATIHFMDSGIDTGDIVARAEVPVQLHDTADSLYHKVKQEEVRLFEREWPRIVSGTFERLAQGPDEGSLHRRSDLFDPDIQRLDLDASRCVGEVLRQLSALTTSDPSEAAYFESAGGRFRVQLLIFPDDPGSD